MARDEVCRRVLAQGRYEAQLQPAQTPELVLQPEDFSDVHTITTPLEVPEKINAQTRDNEVHSPPTSPEDLEAATIR